MTSQPRVSILVPVFKVENFIEHCARSLFEQTFKDIEYIFVNDCTPDNSIAVLQNTLKNYPDRIDQVKIIHHKHNMGTAAARNTLLANASGEYTLFIDSDDWIEKNMVACMYEKAEAEKADITLCDFYTSYPDKELYHHQTCAGEHVQNLRKIISLQINTYLVTMLIRHSLYTSNRIEFLKDINVSEDYIVCVKLFYFARKIVSLPLGLYHYVQYNPNNCSQLTLSNIEDRLKSIQCVEQFCIDKQVIQDVKKDIDGRKFIIKSAFLINKQFYNFNKWKHTFPEANYAWKQFHFRKDYQIIYWLAEHHFFPGIRLVLFLKRLSKKIRTGK